METSPKKSMTITTCALVLSPLTLVVADDIEFGGYGYSKKTLGGVNRWYSEDPNALGSLINDLRDEIGVKQKVEVKKSKLATKKSAGGDSNLIDGPDDYAYNHLNRNRVQRMLPPPSNPMQMDHSMNHVQFNQQAYQNQFYYPYNASYENYQPVSEDYHGAHSFQGYAGNRKPNYPAQYSDQQSWYSNNSFNSMGHPYYEQMNPRLGAAQPVNHFQKNYGRNEAPPNFNNLQVPQPMYHPGGQAFTQDSNSKGSYAERDSSASSDQGNDEFKSGHSGGQSKTSNSKNKNQLKRFKQLIEAKSSSILHVKGLDNDSISAELLNSLFSNFGNILKLLFIKHKKAAFIVYENQDLATIAKEMLGNLRFMDCHLKVASCLPR